MSGSVSSFSEDGSRTGSMVKRPIATPRSKTPQGSRKGGHTVLTRPDMEEPIPPLPPKVKDLPLVPSRSSIPLKKYNSVGVANEPAHPNSVGGANEPARPKMRPSTSEIRRAKNRARAATNNESIKGSSLPELTIVDEDGVRAGGKKKVKKTLSSDQRDAGGKHLLPTHPSPSRQRRKSEGQEVAVPAKAPISSKPTALKEAEEGGALNTEVAGTLLRYIITSEDPSLKEALRDLITKDSKVVSSIKEKSRNNLEH